MRDKGTIQLRKTKEYVPRKAFEASKDGSAPLQQHLMPVVSVLELVP